MADASGSVSGQLSGVSGCRAEYLCILANSILNSSHLLKIMLGEWVVY